MSIPLVSCVVATYNRRDYICAAIDSILCQTYTNVELIVIDDGSTDGTGDLLREKYGEQLRYYFQENSGRSEARNSGMRIARGEYIAFLDSDDLWVPDKLTRQIAFMEAHPLYGLTHTYTSIIDEHGFDQPEETVLRLKVHTAGFRSGYSYEAMSRRCIMFLSTVIIRPEIAQDIGWMDSSIPAFEDWDWYLRAALTSQIGTLCEALTRYRRHEGNSTNGELLNGERITSIKHLALCEALANPVRTHAKRNFYLHLAAVAYKEENAAECAFYLKQAARLDPTVVVRRENLRLTMTAFGPSRMLRRIRRFKRSLVV